MLQINEYVYFLIQKRKMKPGKRIIGTFYSGEIMLI